METPQDDIFPAGNDLQSDDFSAEQDAEYNVISFKR
jgi:hypothetical protein